MNNMRLTITCETTTWELVCPGKETGSWVAACIEKMEDEHREGVRVEIVAQATDDDVTV
jgi:hypothetical protein